MCNNGKSDLARFTLCRTAVWLKLKHVQQCSHYKKNDSVGLSLIQIPVVVTVRDATFNPETLTNRSTKNNIKAFSMKIVLESFVLCLVTP